MLIFFKPSLVFLAVPKTGSTAIELALRGRAEIVISRGRKHMNARGFHSKIAPFLKDAFDQSPQTLAVMREPLDQLSSWYRYRSRLKTGHPSSTKGISFDQFVLDALKESPPLYARIGSQFSFLTSATGDVLVDHVFAYEKLEILHDLLRQFFGKELIFRQANVSPRLTVELSSKTAAKLHDIRAHEFALYDKILKAGGQLNRVKL